MSISCWFHHMSLFSTFSTDAIEMHAFRIVITFYYHNPGLVEFVWLSPCILGQLTDIIRIIIKIWFFDILTSLQYYLRTLYVAQDSHSSRRSNEVHNQKYVPYLCYVTTVLYSVARSTGTYNRISTTVVLCGGHPLINCGSSRTYVRIVPYRNPQTHGGICLPHCSCQNKNSD